MNKHFEKIALEITQNLESKVNRFSGKTVLITGAGGFLGSGFCSFFYFLNKNLLLSNPVKIYAYDNFINGRPDWVELLKNDNNFIFKDENILNINSFPKSDFIIHAASIASPVFYRKYPLETIDANVTGLRKLLDSSRINNPESILFFSTSEIYGNPTKEYIPTPETYFGNVNSYGPRACYDESKRLSETLCYIYNQKFDLPIKIVRPFNNYGPGLNINDGRVIPDFFKNIINDNNIKIFSDGTATRTFCYISDAITGYLLALLSQCEGEIFNIGDDSPEISVNELAELIVSITNSNSQIDYIESKDKEYLTNNPQRRCPDISKAKHLLDYSPKVNLRNGLMNTYEYYKEFN